MKRIDIEKRIGDLNISIHLDSRVCVFSGNSGSGKTYSIKIIKGYARTCGIKCIEINCGIGTDISAEDIISICKNKEIILLDNADLYLTSEILKSISKEDNLIVVCIQNTFCTMGIKGRALYDIEFDSNSLKTIKSRIGNYE